MCVVTISLGFASGARAAGGGFVPGVEGVMAASIPPPGFHYKMHILYYSADTLKDADGNEVPNGFNVDVFASVHRLLWNTGYKFLGADWAIHVIIPFLSVGLDIKAAGISANDAGFGDISLEPLLLGWHGQRWDAAFGLAFNLPTGSYSENNPASCGNNTFSVMLNLGGTFYFDTKKTWSFSALTRTLFYGENSDTKITPGTEMYIEWGLGKEIMAKKDFLVRPGLCGYSYFQLSDDSGTGASSDLGQVHALGAEVNLFWLNGLYQLNLRGLQEFSAQDESEGFKVLLTLIKTF